MQNTLPVNKKEALIYTFLMVVVMAGGMTFFNMAIHNGFNIDSLMKAWMIFPIVAVIAFIIEWFGVSKSAHFLIHKYIKQDDPVIKQVLLSSFFFVIQMVVLMSVICGLLFSKGSDHFWQDMLLTLPRNFVVAFTLKVVIAGPLVGTIFRKLFPIGTIVVEENKNK